ncbi:hypothetical protein PSm6_04400 [Pseudomonas solani]|uniref:Twin-arginine translocation signal domain-containing protein n=1 Tax=Pseudomonas solani TaxID=2731552 RepID=A0ABM7L3J3_9PSED|nr:hypothetical protein [Pseudomonas solani]MDN4144683.1 hypothetical protein [Pseudomonas tohonis]BCD84033.1 hypothetical protein PSm6_04400 [Pseudomonas solani]
MRRRDFMKGAALGSVALTLPEVKASNRLYGTPGSIIARDSGGDNRLRLLMSRGEVPLGVWEDVVDFTRLWSAVSKDAALASEFYSSRSALLERMGISEQLIAPRSVEEQLLLASQDPIVRAASKDGDYPRYLGRLNEMGIFAASSKIRQRVNDLLESDPEDLKGLLTRSVPEQMLESEYASDLQKLKAILTPEDGSSSLQRRSLDAPVARAAVGAVAIAVVAVGVATYVVAAVNVAIGVNLAVQLSVVVNVAVRTGGGGGSSCGGGCHGVQPGQMLDVDSAAVRLAQASGNSRLLSQGLRRQVRKEVIACAYAAHELGVISLPRVGRKQALDLLCGITYRMAGI